MSVPAILTSTIQLDPGATLQGDTGALRNPFRSGMYIHSVKFRVDMAAASTGDGTMLPIYAQLNMGRHWLMPRQVPVYRLDKVYVAGTDIGATLAAVQEWNCYIWRFPKPLYVPEGEVLVPNLYYSPDQGSNDTDVDVVVSYNVSSTEDEPKEINVPFANVWVGAGSNQADAATVEASNENDLVNPYQEDVFVKRMCGIITREFRTVDTGGCSDAAINAPAIGNSLLNLTIISSSGQSVGRDPIPFNHLFAQDRSWTINTWLKSHAYMLVTAYEDLSSMTTSGGGTRVRPQIVINGYRRVRI